MLFISSVFASPDCVGATKQSKVILCIKANPIFSHPPILFDVAQGQAPLPSPLGGKARGCFLRGLAPSYAPAYCHSQPRIVVRGKLQRGIQDKSNSLDSRSGAGMTIEERLRREDRERGRKVKGHKKTPPFSGGV